MGVPGWRLIGIDVLLASDLAAAGRLDFLARAVAWGAGELLALFVQRPHVADFTAA